MQYPTLSAVVLALGAMGYGALHLLSYSQADASFARTACDVFYVCDDAARREAAFESLWSADPEEVQRSVEAFEELVAEAPTVSGRWADLGEARLRAGDSRGAAAAFANALRFAGASPPVLLRAAFFYEEIGRRDDSIATMRRMLALTRGYDTAAFGFLNRMAYPPPLVLDSILPADPHALRAYFVSLLPRGDVDDLAEVWRRLLATRAATPNELAQYVKRLINLGALEEAVAAQAAFVGEDAWPEADIIFNGGFEADLLGSELDWELLEHAAISASIDQEIARSGSRSLRIKAMGGHDDQFRHVLQAAVAQAGRYRCSAFVRSEGWTTSEGVGWRILDVASRSTIAEGERVTGDTPWMLQTASFELETGPRELRWQLLRSPSNPHEGEVAGRFWIDDVSCVRVP